MLIASNFFPVLLYLLFLSATFSFTQNLDDSSTLSPVDVLAVPINDQKWNQSRLDKFKRSRFYRKSKFIFRYLQKQFYSGLDNSKGDICQDCFQDMGMKPAYMTNFSQDQRDKAYRAMQYAIIARQITHNPTPDVIGAGTGLCDDYHLRFLYESSVYGTKLALYESESTFVLAFKGTTTLKELFKIDLYVAKTQCKVLMHCGLAHAGFLRGYRELKPKIAIISEIVKLKPLVVTGHSLGGVFAVISAYDLAKQHGKLVSGIYTLGSPKVGDQEFVNDFDDLISENVEIVKIALADERQIDPVSKSPTIGMVHVAEKQKPLILPCINEYRQHCTIVELHTHWNYILALSKIASKKCGVFDQPDDIVSMSAIRPVIRPGFK